MTAAKQSSRERELSRLDARLQLDGLPVCCRRIVPSLQAIQRAAAEEEDQIVNERVRDREPAGAAAARCSSAASAWPRRSAV